MNEWEWQLLEDKTPVDQRGDCGRCGRRRAIGCACILAKAGMYWTSLWPARRRPLRPWSRTTKARFMFAWCWTTIPGRDMGLLRQPGHRFFFDPEEVEPLPRGDRSGGAGGGRSRPFWLPASATFSWGRRLWCGGGPAVERTKCPAGGARSGLRYSRLRPGLCAAGRIRTTILVDALSAWADAGHGFRRSNPT